MQLTVSQLYNKQKGKTRFFINIFLFKVSLISKVLPHLILLVGFVIISKWKYTDLDLHAPQNVVKGIHRRREIQREDEQEAGGWGCGQALLGRSTSLETSSRRC